MSSSNNLLTHDAESSRIVEESIAEEQLFMYHPKHGAELFNPSEVKELEKHGWVDTFAGFKCQPYDKKKSYKAKYARKYNKKWNISVYTEKKKSKGNK